MLPSPPTLFILLAILLLQTSAFHLLPSNPPTTPSNRPATSTPSTPQTNNPVHPASPTLSPTTTASSTTTRTTSSHPAPPPNNLRCLRPTRHDLFFAHPDLPHLTFNIHTPWTLTYPSRLAAALRARNYTVVTAPPHRTCNWRALGTVSHQLVRRGTLSRTVGLAGWAAADGYGGVGALAGNVEEVGRAMRATYPAVEVVMILGFTLWPVYVTVMFGVVACVAMCFRGRRT